MELATQSLKVLVQTMYCGPHTYYQNPIDRSWVERSLCVVETALEELPLFERQQTTFFLLYVEGR